MMKLFKVSSFRAIVLYLALFLLSAGLVGSFLYNQINANLTKMNDNMVWRDAAMISRSYERSGLAALSQTLDQQSQLNPEGVYLLADGLGQYLGGNLAAFPSPTQTTNQADGWQIIRSDGSQNRAADQPMRETRARLIRLDDDLILLIGRDLSAQRALMGQVEQSFLTALLLLVGLGLLGGGVMARQALARVEKINRSLRPIMAGDFSARIPMGRGQDEFGDLEQQINQMLARIQSLMAEMREVSDNLAHDLRSPLTRLRGRLDNLRVDAASYTPEVMEDSLSDIDQLLGIFSSILALSKLESGAAARTFQPVNLTALLDDVVDLYDAAFEADGWTLSYDIPREGDIYVSGDAPLLGQAVVNLLDNARAYGAGETRQLKVHVSLCEGEVQLTIADCGAGVPDNELAHIRQRFVRLDNSRSAAGNGLGLSLVDAICRHHGGRLVLSAHQPSGLRADIILAQRQ
jgi:signal transduction histidine kinase